MQVKQTYIVVFENGFRVIYHTFDNRWFITTVNEPDLIIEIDSKKAYEYIAKTKG